MSAERKHTYNLILVMALGGIFGGVGNYLLLPTTSNGSFWKSLFLGVIAAGALPLFLKMISSNLIDYEPEGMRYKNYLILAAFCILIGVFADVFLQGLYSKVFHDFEDKLESFEEDIKIGKRRTELLRQHIQKLAFYNKSSFQQSDWLKIKSTYQLNDDELKLFQKIQDSMILNVRDSSKINQVNLKKLSDNELIEVEKLNGELWISPSYRNPQFWKFNRGH